MVMINPATYDSEFDFHSKSMRHLADRRVRTPKAAREAMRIAELVAAGAASDQAPDEKDLFAALNVCAYRATRRAWRKAIPAPERAAWVRRWKLIRDFIVERNVGLVYSTLTRFRPNSGEWEDLRSEAFLALVRAMEGFDPWRGFRFSTYACSAILRALIHASRKAQKYRLQFPLELDVGREIPEQEEAESDLYVERLRQALDRNLGELTEREAKVLARRFPLDGKLRLTLQEIGVALGLSKERVRQIQKSALNKLREVLEADPVLQ